MIHAGVIHVGLDTKDGTTTIGTIIGIPIDTTQHGMTGTEELLETGEINGLTDTMLMVSVELVPSHQTNFFNFSSRTTNHKTS